jgi:hypothetical protein
MPERLPDVPPRFPRQAECDFYRSLIDKYGGYNSAAARYAEKVVAHVQGHSGGPSACELRRKWDEAHPFGPSGRTFRPDDFAFAFAAQAWGNAANDECAKLGMHPRWRACVEGRFQADTVELKQLGYNARIFTREMLGALIRAQLPGKLCEAATPAEWQRLVNVAIRLPDWVLDAPAADAETAAEAAASPAGAPLDAAAAQPAAREPAAAPSARHRPRRPAAAARTVSAAPFAAGRSEPGGEGLEPPPVAQASPPAG